MPKIPITPPYRGTDELAPGSGGVELIDGYCDPLPEGGYALYRRGGLWAWWWSGLQNQIDGMYWWEEKQTMLVSCDGRVFAFANMIDAPTEITSANCRINFGSPTVFSSSGAWVCMTSKNSVPISSVSDGGLPLGHVARVMCGRTKYIEVGWMWRPQSDKQYYLSPDGSYERRRYVTGDTQIIVERA